MIIDIFRLKRNKQIAEDEKLRLKITLAWWNPSEVNPAPSLGKWTKKTHFGTDFIHNTFENYPQCPIDKRKSFQTSKQEILSPLVWKYLNITGREFGQYEPLPPWSSYPKENICKMNQFVTNHYWGEPGLINMSKLPFVKKKLCCSSWNSRTIWSGSLRWYGLGVKSFVCLNLNLNLAGDLLVMIYLGLSEWY